MNRRDLVQAVAAHTGADPKSVDATLKGITDVLTAAVAKGEVVAISGFAKFARVSRPARWGRNPATGETIRIKASRKARITPLKAFKDVVLGVTPAPKVTAAKAAPAKKAPARKATTARKAPARKTTTARKAPARKTTARKTATTRKAAPARKTTVKRAPARKTAAKKTTAKKATRR